MKKKMTVLAVLLLAVVTTTYSVSGTYAKYTSTFEGATSTARVAKWAFEFDEEAADTNNEFVFDLFDTVNEADTTTTEADVESANTDNVIAPGTGGSFEIKLANKSEVNAKYTVDYTVNKTAAIPVEFSIDNGQHWTTDLVDVTTGVPIAMNGGQDTIKIQWRWAFEGTASENYTASQTDGTDTTLGEAGTDTISVKADITVTQVD